MALVIGVVKDSGEDPIEGATVKWYDCSTDNLEGSATTNEFGVASTTIDPGDRYAIAYKDSSESDPTDCKTCGNSSPTLFNITL